MIPTTCKYCGGPVGFHDGSPMPLCTACNKVLAPWPHDPRTAPLSQPTEEQLGQALKAFSDHPETFAETVERIGKATAEDVDEVWPNTLTVIGSDPADSSKTVYQIWERNGRRLDFVTGGPVLRQEGDWLPEEVEALVNPQEELEPVISVDWGSGEPETVYSAMQDGKMIYSTPEREEFSAWLERDGLKEVR